MRSSGYWGGIQQPPLELVLPADLGSRRFDGADDAVGAAEGEVEFDDHYWKASLARESTSAAKLRHSLAG